MPGLTRTWPDAGFVTPIRAAPPSSPTRSATYTSGFLDAWWYWTAEQRRHAAEAFARAMEHTSAEQLYVHGAAV